jgi:hypothetical protein
LNSDVVSLRAVASNVCCRGKSMGAESFARLVSKLASKHAAFILFYSNLLLFILFMDSLINQCEGVIIARTVAL